MIKYVIASLIFSMFSGCQYVKKHESKDAATSDRTEDLRKKYDEIYAEVEASLDPETGMPGRDDCDLALWAGLACSIGMPVKIELLEYSPGEIHRRPFKACWNETEGDVGSKSTISKDMISGYSACLWARKDLQGLQRLADYGEKNDWIMGKPSELLSRVLLSGNGIGLIGRAIYSLSSGSDDRYYRRIGFLFPKVEADFERHIQTHGILLQDSVDDSYNLTSINDEMLDRLIENAELEPSNSLFAAALGRFTGDQSKAISLLLDPKTPCPSYARGETPDTYCKIDWLKAAKLVIGE
jgi:hypothetical protein